METLNKQVRIQYLIRTITQIKELGYDSPEHLESELNEHINNENLNNDSDLI